MGISRVTIWVIGVINLLTKPPDPASTTLDPVNCKASGAFAAGHGPATRSNVARCALGEGLGFRV